jgi:hypothetical protein
MAVASLAARIVAVMLGALFAIAIGNKVSLPPDPQHGRWNPFVLLGAAIHIALLLFFAGWAVRLRDRYPSGRGWKVLPWVLAVVLIAAVQILVAPV